MAVTIGVSSVTFNTTAGAKNCNLPAKPNDLLIAFCAHSGITTSHVVTDDGAGPDVGSWSQIISALNNTSLDTLSIWVRNQLIQRGSGASNMVVTTTPSSSTGGGITVIQVAGMRRAGLAAVRAIAGVLQTAKQENQAAGTPAPVFPAAPLATNPILGFILDATNGSANALPRSSPAYTEQVDSGYNTPTTGEEIMTLISGESSATITWGGATPSGFASAVVELDASDPNVYVPFAIPAAMMQKMFGLGIPAPVILDNGQKQQDATATPATVAGVGAVPAPSAGGGATGTPAAVVGLADISTPPYFPLNSLARFANSGTAGVSVALPAGVKVDDVLLMFIETNGDVVATPTGWAHVPGSPVAQGAGAHPTAMTVFYKRYALGDTSPVTAADPGDHWQSQMFAFRKVVRTGSPFDTNTQASTDLATGSVVLTGITTTVNLTRVIAAVARGNSSSPAEFSAEGCSTLLSLVETDGVDTGSSVIGDGGGYVFLDGLKQIAGPTGNITLTDAVATNDHASLVFALLPDTVLGPPMVTGDAAATPAAVTGVGAVPAPTITADGKASPTAVAGLSAISLNPGVASDDFNRADSDSLGSTSVGGYAWTEAGTVGMQIVSNTVRSNASPPESQCATIELGSGYTDYEVLCTPTAGSYPGIIGRFTDYTNDRGLLVLWPHADQVQLLSVVAGVTTDLGSNFSFTNYGAGAPTRLRIVGDAVRVYVGNTLAISYLITQAALRTGTKVGVSAYIGGAEGAAIVDAFQVGTFGVVVLGNATATPSAVAGVGAIPAPTITTTNPDATVTPAAVAGVGAVPAPTIIADALTSPSAVAGVATITSPTINLTTTSTPSAVAGIGAVPAPTVIADALTSPSVVAGTGAVPSPTILGPATATPSAVAGLGAVPAPTITAFAMTSPAVVAGTGAVPSPNVIGDALTAPSVVAGIGAVPSVTITAGATTTPSAVTGVGAVPTSTINLMSTATPVAVAGIGDVPATMPIADANLAPSVVAGVGAVPSPSAIAPATTTPSAVVGTGDVPAPTLHGEANAIPSVVASIGTVPSSTINLTTTATPPAVTGVGVVPDPTTVAPANSSPSTVGGTSAINDSTVHGDANTGPSTVVGVGDVPAPVISVGGAITALPSVVAAVGAVPAPVIHGDASTTPSSVDGVGTVLDPTIVTTSGSTATPSAVAGTGSIPSPTVTASANLSVDTTVGVATIPSPTTQGGANSNPVTVGGTTTIGATVLATAVVSVSAVAGIGRVPSPIINTGTTTISEASILPTAVGSYNVSIRIQGQASTGITLTGSYNTRITL